MQLLFLVLTAAGRCQTRLLIGTACSQELFSFHLILEFSKKIIKGTVTGKSCYIRDTTRGFSVFVKLCSHASDLSLCLVR